MPKKYSLKFGGGNPEHYEADFTMIYIIGFCILCCCCSLISGVIGYFSLDKCDDKNDLGRPKVVCDDLKAPIEGKLCFGECKKSECCGDLICNAPSKVRPDMLSSDVNDLSPLKYNAVKDFDSQGILKSELKPDGLVTCDTSHGWLSTYSINRCKNNEPYWSIECDDSIHKKCLTDNIDDDDDGVRSRNRNQVNNCEDIDITESGEGLLGDVIGAVRRLGQSESDQRLICESFYSLSSGSSGNFCTLETGPVNSCTTSATPCRGPGPNPRGN